MNLLTMEDLRRFQEPPAPAPHWVRVGLDTGGIAAGAREVYEALMAEKLTGELAVDIRPAGSLGYSYADPVVMFGGAGLPSVMCGALDPTSAVAALHAHVAGRPLPHGHILASRDRAQHLDGAFQHTVLVQDTSQEGGDKTESFQLAFEEALAAQGLQHKVRVIRTLDMGLYQRGKCVQLLPSRVTYSHVLTALIGQIIEASIRHDRVVEELLVRDGDPQQRIVLRHCGHIDPDSLEEYLQAGGYQGFGRLLHQLTPEAVIDEMKVSGLRGRGGAGFPTWLKWKITREAPGEAKVVICNADEGDPGAFMDRSVMEGDPHAVLEGLLTAAYAIGAHQGYFYIRAEYPLAVARMERALEQARAAGLLGTNILGAGFAFDAEIRLGAGAFVCGEETALIASIEGKRGSPSPRPPYPSMSGLWGRPTSINNVETLAAIPAICQHGGAWYAGFGTEKSRGTKVFAVTGKVRNSQLVEVPMGLPIRTIVEDICGGAMQDETIKAVQTGGPSGGVIPERLLDTPVTYENLLELGSIMGSGGMLVMDKYDCMVDVAKFYLKFCVDESCGKCSPCRIGGYQMLQLLDKIHRGRGDAEDLTCLRRICTCMQTASLCGLGQTAPNPVLSTLRYFEDEYRAYLEGGAAYARKMKKQAATGGRTSETVEASS